jgi:hypothetical protein
MIDHVLRPQARLLLVDALETDDFREVADPALECRFSKTEMRRMVEAAAACVRHSAAKRPRMVQVNIYITSTHTLLGPKHVREY